MGKQNTVLRVLNGVKSLFLSGLFTLLPLALTLALLTFTFKLIKSWVNPLYLLVPKSLQKVPQVEILLILLTIFIVGAVLKFFLLHQLIEFLEKIFSKIPLLRQIYFGIKQLIAAFGQGEKEHFRKVVLIEFPKQGVFSLGFLTSETPSRLHPCKEKEEKCETYYNVFVPNTPNPTSGFHLIVPAKECQEIDITRQEAITIIISGGIVQPHRFKKK